jgi:hypothetical protein
MPPDPATLRSFSRSLLLGLPVTGLLWMAILRYFQGQWLWSIPAITTGLGIALFTIIRLSPATGEAIHRIWEGLRRVTETIISTATLALVYYLVITPAGWLRRTLSRSPLEFDFKHPAKPTFWKPAPPRPEPASYLKQH